MYTQFPYHYYLITELQECNYYLDEFSVVMADISSMIYITELQTVLYYTFFNTRPEWGTQFRKTARNATRTAEEKAKGTRLGGNS
jgi:hypothetical protein